MLNPEFKRNLWREFPGHRLVAMPVMLGLIFLTVGLADSNRSAEYLYRAATVLFVFIVWFWGGRNANCAVSDELRDHTWDQQRLSALDPWTMTWGKLFGATSYNWYGGAICLTVALPAGLSAHGASTLSSLLAMLASGVLIQATIMTLAIHLGRQSSAPSQSGSIGWLGIILVFTAFAKTAVPEGGHSVTWWNQPFDQGSFWLAGSLGFAACATFAAWRVMATALQVRTRPWAWPLFSLLLATYLAGFGESLSPARLANLPLVGLALALAMTYATLFTEPCGPLELRRLRLRQQAGDWRGWLEYLPLWPTTLAAAFVYALLATAMMPATPAAELATAHNLTMLAGIAPLAVALMLLRDCCLYLFFACAKQPRHTAWTTLLSLAALDVLLPFSAKAAGLGQLAWYIMPFGGNTPWSAALVMAVQAGLALSLVSWRCR